jgi:nicotinamide-nucleotide amidase
MDRKINAFIKHLNKKGLTLAFAESITCGMAAHKLATVPGTSEVLKGSVVCYTPEVKHGLLGVPEKLMNKYTCESMQVTERLAAGLQKIIKADVYAALTGLAAPGGSETKEKPVGTVFFCINYKNKKIKQRKLFRGTPLQIREKACITLYELIKKNT